VARSRRVGLDLRPGPFFKAAANRLDLRSRKGFPVTVAGTIAALSFLAFLAVAEDIVEQAKLALDTSAILTMNSLVNPVLTRVMVVITHLGDFQMMVVEVTVAAILLAVWGHPRRAGSVVLLVSVGAVLVEALKSVFARPRPTVLVELLAKPGSMSFPSGHAMSGLLLFGTLALMLSASRLPKWVRFWGSLGTVLLGLTIGVSRIYLGVHYASDVLGAWLLGTTMLATWAAAVLVWGRTQPPLEERVVRPWGRLWWRWALAGAGGVLVVVALVLDTAHIAIP
jgi:undecaprenyl-diphosphatase